jgi:hypothetical protein
MIMKSTKDPKEVVVEESSGQVFEEGVTGVRGTRRDVEILRTNDSSGTGCRHLASKSEVDRDGEAAWRHTTEREEESPR